MAASQPKLAVATPQSQKRLSNSASEAMHSFRQYQRKQEIAKRMTPKHKDDSCVSLTDEHVNEEVTTKAGDNETQYR